MSRKDYAVPKKMFLATYDLKETTPDGHALLLQKAVANGWFRWIVATDGLKYQLPNTTLDGWFDSYEAAFAALDLSIRQMQAVFPRAVVEKWIIVDYTSARFGSDKKAKA